MQLSRATVLDYDAVLQHIGAFGRWQRRIFLLMSLVSAASGVMALSWVFTGYQPRVRCQIPYCEGAPAAYYGPGDARRVPDFARSSVQQLKGCAYYRPAGAPENLSCAAYIDVLNGTNASLVPHQCDSFVFDTSVMRSSAVSEYDLVCHRANLQELCGSLYMFGVLAGSLFFGRVSDRYGRRTGLMIAIALSSCSGVLSVAMPTVSSFAFLRFLSGVGSLGLFLSCFTICVEFVGPSHTALVGIAIQIPWSIGGLLVGLAAWFVRDWQALQLLLHVPIVGLLALGLVPESPRWLVANGHVDRAIKVIRGGAAANRCEPPEQLIAAAQAADASGQTTPDPDLLDCSTPGPAAPAAVEKASIFRPRCILLRTVNMAFQWFAVNLTFYGLSFTSTSLAGDPHLNFSLSIVSEIPGTLLCLWLLRRGRQRSLVLCQLVSGICCIAAGLLMGSSLGGLQVALAAVGKLMASAVFDTVYLYTAELFPTAIRSTAVGTCSAASRVGSILAMSIGILGRYWAAGPMVVMGAMAVLAGVAAQLMPETLGRGLPETMQEAIDLGRGQSGDWDGVAGGSQSRGWDGTAGARQDEADHGPGDEREDGAEGQCGSQPPPTILRPLQNVA